ncbi:MAG TPA: YkgJ family cysteine cluster protein [Methanocorpusculum sp.]|nr:YkgJ family cysteine cluster protein [Methanocorpusculum sp.]
MLEDDLKKSGFRCRMCAKCCSGPDNEVMVSPDEIDVLCRASGLAFSEIAGPYPEWLPKKGGRFTLGWVLRRGKDGNCMFLENGRCRYYQVRPHICRTYPFMLNEGKLLISECDGICEANAPLSDGEAKELARALRDREAAEAAEAQATAVQYQKNSNITGTTIIYDSRGAHIIND